jgi:hypothetical protein
MLNQRALFGWLNSSMWLQLEVEPSGVLLHKMRLFCCDFWKRSTFYLVCVWFTSLYGLFVLFLEVGIVSLEWTYNLNYWLNYLFRDKFLYSHLPLLRDVLGLSMIKSSYQKNHFFQPLIFSWQEHETIKHCRTRWAVHEWFLYAKCCGL